MSANPAARKRDRSEFHIHTLKNGIRCLFKRINSPVAYSAVTINAGSRDESEREFGIAHFTEHSLFKGTQKRRACHINSRLERLGGELNAFTTKEETVIHATTLRRDLAKGAEMISDILFHSIFPEKEIEKEREVILDEINSYKDSPADRIYDEFEDLLFEGSSLGHNILGTEEHVSGFTGADIKKYTDRCYNTDSMVFSVAADITPRAFVAICEKYFEQGLFLPRGYERAAPGKASRFETRLDYGTHQAHCIIGARAYDMYNPKRIAMSLLTNVLGGPASNSMLNTIVREKYGLTYNIEASYSPYSDTGISAIYFGTDHCNSSRCIELVHSILGKLRNTALSTRQMAAAKNQFTGQLAISMEGNEAYMLGSAKSLLMYNDIDSPEEIYRKISLLTSSDIMDAANEVFANPSILVFNGHRSAN